MHDLDIALDGVAQRVERAAGFAVVAGDDEIGVIEQASSSDERSTMYRLRFIMQPGE